MHIPENTAASRKLSSHSLRSSSRNTWEFLCSSFSANLPMFFRTNLVSVDQIWEKRLKKNRKILLVSESLLEYKSEHWKLMMQRKP